MTIKKLSVAFLFAAVLLIPGNAFANSVNDIEDELITSHNNKLEQNWQDTPNPMQDNIDTNLIDL